MLGTVLEAGDKNRQYAYSPGAHICVKEIGSKVNSYNAVDTMLDGDN